MKPLLTKYETDKVLWEAFRRGQDDAFKLIFNRYYQDLYFYGCKLIENNNNLVEDELQDFFAEIWHRKHRLGEVNYIKAYLIKSFRRRLIKKVEKQRKQLATLKNIKHQLIQFEVSTEELIISEEFTKEQLKALKTNLENLNVTQKEIIYLRFYNNLDYQTIAEIVGIKYQSVRNSMHKAIKSLRKKMV